MGFDMVWVFCFLKHTDKKYFKWTAVIPKCIYFGYLTLVTQANLQGGGEGQEEKDKGKNN